MPGPPSLRIRLIVGLLGALTLGGLGLALRSAAPAPAAAAAHLSRTAESVRRTGTTAQPTPKGGTRWITSWGAATQGPNAAAPLSEQGFDKRTLRQVVFLTAGGSQVRVRFSNVFGSKPLHIGAASVGVQRRGAWTVPGTTRQLHFYGRPGVTIRPGHEALSDPVRLGVKALTRIAISLYLPKPTGPATQQVESRETSYAAHGSRALQASGRGFGQKLQDWYFLAGVETRSPSRDVGALVALGDSITAGIGSASGANASWPDDLARRLTG